MYTPIIKTIDGVSALTSEKNNIYFADVSSSKLYRAKHHDKKFEIDVIHDKLAKIHAIQALDKYLYIVDAVGLHVLKTSND